MGSIAFVEVHVSRWVCSTAPAGVPATVIPMIGTSSAVATSALDRTANLFISSFIS